MSSPKTHCLYIVIPYRNRWWVDCEGKAHGPFSSQEMAGRSAIEIARIFGESDRPWQVLSRGENGRFTVIADSQTDGERPTAAKILKQAGLSPAPPLEMEPTPEEQAEADAVIGRSVDDAAAEAVEKKAANG